MKRRNFVQRSLELVIAARCLPLLDVRLAAQPRSGLPQLTEASLNAIIPKDAVALRVFVGQMFPDMKAFIRARFTLSAEQNRALDGISASTIARIQKAVEAAAAKGATVTVAATGDARLRSDLREEISSNTAVRIVAEGPCMLALRESAR